MEEKSGMLVTENIRQVISQRDRCASQIKAVFMHFSVLIPGNCGVKLYINESNSQKYQKTKLSIIVLAGSHAFTVIKVFFW